MDFITRAEWGARSPKNIQTVGWNARTGFVVHHSGASPTQSVRSIQDYHMDHNGWSDIGYNWLVDGSGLIYEGRGWDRVGAHTLGHNTETIGVCLIGDYTVIDPPPSALAALQTVYQTANLYKVGVLRPFGHQDLNQTDCPGARLYAWVHGGGLGSPAPVPPPPSGTHLPGTRTLRLTTPPMSGQDVAYVQRFIGPAECGPDDGVYGPRTDSGVRWYQHMRGIAVDGIVGPVTWSNMSIRWSG